MRLTRILAGTVGLLMPFALQAQSFQEAEALTQMGPQGTARSRAAGGAFGVVGGDMGGLATNPAGAAVFRRSQIQLTTGFYFNNVDANLLGSSEANTRLNVRVPSAGILFAVPINNKGALRSASIGFGYNQVENFNKRYEVTAFNPTNSISTAFADNLAGADPSQLNFDNPGDPQAQAYNTAIEYQVDAFEGFVNESGLLTNLGDPFYTGAFDRGQIDQTYELLTRGKHNDIFLNGALNFNDILFLGAGFNFSQFDYFEQRTIQEFDRLNVYNDGSFTSIDTSFGQSLEYREEAQTNGAGIGGSFGFILAPLPFVRFGASYQTPRYFLDVRTVFENRTSYTLDDRRTASIISLEGEFFHDIAYTPGKLHGGVAFILGSSGLFSVEGTYSEPNNFQYNFRADDDLNQEINARLADQQYSLRAGGEYRVGNLYFRGGAAYVTSPYSDFGTEYLTPYRLDDDGSATAAPTTVRVQTDRLQLSGGLGVRGKNFFFDVAYTHDIRNEVQLMYEQYEGVAPITIGPTLELARTTGTVLVTLGISFDMDE